MTFGYDDGQSDHHWCYKWSRSVNRNRAMHDDHDYSNLCSKRFCPMHRGVQRFFQLLLGARVAQDHLLPTSSPPSPPPPPPPSYPRAVRSLFPVFEIGRWKKKRGGRESVTLTVRTTQPPSRCTTDWCVAAACSTGFLAYSPRQRCADRPLRWSPLPSRHRSTWSRNYAAPVRTDHSERGSEVTMIGNALWPFSLFVLRMVGDLNSARLKKWGLGGRGGKGRGEGGGGGVRGREEREGAKNEWLK